LSNKTPVEITFQACFTCTRQGCQIFLDTIYQNMGKYTKLPQLYQIALEFTKWPQTFQIFIKYTNIFHSKALQNLSKSGFFWSENIPSGNPGTRALCESDCFWAWAQCCQIFRGANLPKRRKYTKWPQTIPKYSNWSKI
jgi:hypothetical protein